MKVVQFPSSDLAANFRHASNLLVLKKIYKLNKSKNNIWGSDFYSESVTSGVTLQRCPFLTGNDSRRPILVLFLFIHGEMQYSTWM